MFRKMEDRDGEQATQVELSRKVSCLFSASKQPKIEKISGIEFQVGYCAQATKLEPRICDKKISAMSSEADRSV